MSKTSVDIVEKFITETLEIQRKEIIGDIKSKLPKRDGLDFIEEAIGWNNCLEEIIKLLNNY